MRRLFRHEVKSAAIELEQFKARLYARIFLLLIFVTQVGQRIYFVLIDKQTKASTDVYEQSFPFLGGVIVIVLGEALLYKKIGIRILKYTGYVSALFFLVATAEWMVTLYAAVVRSITCGSQAGYNVPSIFGFTSFSWRIMMQIFIVQRWYLRIIAPTLAYGMVMGYGIHVAPQSTGVILVRGLLQIAYIILIFYFEQKINFKLLFTTLHQEKWLKMNEFILNNVPEKIAILDLDGTVKFTSEYFKLFMKKCGFPDDMNSLLKQIKDLQQHYENDMLSVSGPDRSSLERSVSVAASREPNIERADTLDELIKGFRTLIVSGAVAEGTFLIFNGKLKPEAANEKSIEVKISFNKQQNKPFIILLLRDTTQRDQIVSLEASNKYKDHLLASVSHELRTPLNGTINLVETALSSKQIPHHIKEDLLAPALNSSKFLLHIINDILDMSQIKAEKLRLIFQEANIKETITNAVKLLGLNARMKGITLELTIDPETPTMFCTDHVRLSQIVLNLVHNSIKFTPQGSVSVNVQPVNGMPWIKVIVKDSGIGMTKEDVKKLFNVFTHIELHNRVNINPTGAGLGLSIAHNLAQLLGPKESNGIKVNSVPEQGSTFSFIIEDRGPKDVIKAPPELVVDKRLKTNSMLDEKEESPLVIDDDDMAEEPRGYQRVISCVSTKSMKALTSVGIEATRDECRCPKVLIVDDDAFNMLAYKSILASLGVKCDCVYSGKTGVDKLIWRVNNPCSRDCRGYVLVFMDQEMPGLNGTETVAEIKRLEIESLLPETKVIGCTAHKDGPEIQQFLQSGIAKCIEKPISVGLIQDILEEYHIVES